MKRLLFVSLILVVVPAVVFAQAGQIGLFADPGGADCNLMDTSPGPITVYVVLIDHGGAGACDFSVRPGPGFNASFVSDTPVVGTIFGTSQTGVSIILGACLTEPTHVLTINYNGFGVSSTCSSLDIGDNVNVTPPSPSITTCVGAKNLVPGKSMFVNPDASCTCAVPVEQTTWGHIKSLYSGNQP
ncbi:MAG: hypothetical protein ACE5EO_00960 [Candidatus Krumholzibacteriia bacterium]